MSSWSPPEAWCLVLSGGGAKGVYHIGAWQALKELGIPVRGFVGNSIGAIVAGYLAGGKDQELAEVAATITLDTFLAVPEGTGSFVDLWKAFVARGGLDTGPLRALLNRHIDEEAVRASGNDLGLVTVNLSDLEPREVFLDQMEPGTLVDYLMASSAFPGFASPRIDGKRYVDGGLWDNLPYEMARSRGWKKIVLLDVSGLGLNRRPDFAGAQTVYVKNSITMGGALDFGREFLDSFGRLGYLDTLRAFGTLGGRYAFLEPNPALESEFRALWGDRPWPSKSLPKELRHDRRRGAVLLDCAAAVLELDRFRTWSYQALAEAIAAKAASEDQAVEAALKGAGIVALVRVAVETGHLTASPYRFAGLVRACFQGRTRAMLERMLVALQPELPGAWLYFEIRNEGWCASTPTAVVE